MLHLCQIFVQTPNKLIHLGKTTPISYVLSFFLMGSAPYSLELNSSSNFCQYDFAVAFFDGDHSWKSMSLILYHPNKISDIADTHLCLTYHDMLSIAEGCVPIFHFYLTLDLSWNIKYQHVSQRNKTEWHQWHVSDMLEGSLMSAKLYDKEKHSFKCPFLLCMHCAPLFLKSSKYSNM